MYFYLARPIYLVWGRGSDSVNHLYSGLGWLSQAPVTCPHIGTCMCVREWGLVCVCVWALTCECACDFATAWKCCYFHYLLLINQIRRRTQDIEPVVLLIFMPYDWLIKWMGHGPRGPLSPITSFYALDSLTGRCYCTSKKRPSSYYWSPSSLAVQPLFGSTRQSSSHSSFNKPHTIQESSCEVKKLFHWRNYFRSSKVMRHFRLPWCQRK